MNDRGDMSADGAYSSTSRATLNSFQFSGSPYTGALDVQYFYIEPVYVTGTQGIPAPLGKIRCSAQEQDVWVGV